MTISLLRERRSLRVLIEPTRPNAHRFLWLETNRRPRHSCGLCSVDIFNGMLVRQTTHVLNIRTAHRGLVEITREIRAWVDSQAVTTGLLTIFCKHTSASLLIQENAAPE